MIKKILAVAITAQCLVSCSKQDSAVDNTVPATVNQVDLLNLPYSSLTPEQQKAKLENEGNVLLTMLDKTKTSSAIEAIQNLERLLEIDEIDYLAGRNNNQVSDLLNIANVYGIYTWNNSMQKWVKTVSTTELKFEFPSKKTQTSNDAVLSSNGVSSGVKVDAIDTHEVGQWTFNPVTGQYQYVILTPAVKDQFELPSSVNSILKINNIQAATFALSNTFSSGNTRPDVSNFTITTNDGYTWNQSFAKGANSTYGTSLKLDNKNIVTFTNGSTAKIDDLIDGNTMSQYLGKSNTLIELTDNLAVIGNQDTERMQNAIKTVESNLVQPSYSTSTYYSNKSAYNRQRSEGTTIAVNNNTKLALVSRKDGTKIADVIYKTVKIRSDYMPYVWNATTNQWVFSTTGGQTLDTYDEIPYLKFNDNTQVEMKVYFSSGFSTLQTNYNNYIAAFRR
ncbi:MAG: hypothetical protein QM535_13785 [Limnohabitans sp.]|nr:hypothetical protein [Limnohabitans sp.]